MLSIHLALFLVCALPWSMSGAGNPALNVRLTTSLTSYDGGANVQFSSVAIAPYLQNGVVKIPAGAVVRGVVTKTKRVGLGLIHERATLALEFREYELPDGRRFPMRGVLKQIDNARETVDKNGEVKGILAANGPQSLVGGLWHMPDFDRFSRSFIGLTGAGGRIMTHYSLGPFGGLAVFAVRCAIFRLPEPEIQLTPGTEMYVRVTELPADSPTFEAAAESKVPMELKSWLASLPVEITKPNGLPAADIINMAFSGTRKELQAAFREAGWVEADSMNARSRSRFYKAYSSQSGYAAAPVSKLLYQDTEPDLVYQKSFNTLAKRHHIRLWETEYEGKPLWLAAATHDVGVRYESGLKMTHQIHPKIDWERKKVANDLSFTGCVDAPGFVNREHAIRNGGEGKGIISDGRLAFLQLHTDCAHQWTEFTRPDQPKPALARMARRMILEGRQYVVRGNAYYWGYRIATYRPSQNRKIGIEE